MSASPDILELIQKLLRLADVSSGATEHEAEAAMAKAKELMTRHKIDSAMLRAAQDRHGFAVQKETIGLTKRVAAADTLILLLLKEHFNVRIVLLESPHETAVDIIGIREDVQFAVYVFYFLRETFPRCWNEFKAGDKVSDQKSYYWGLHDGLKNAILEGKNRAEETASTVERDRYQLVMVDTDAAMDQYMSEQYGGHLRKRHSRGRRVHAESYRAGMSKGGEIEVNRPLPESAA